MNASDLQSIAEFSFTLGVTAGLVLSAVIAVIAWKYAATVKLADAAARIAEAAAVRAEADVAERRLRTAQRSLREIGRQVFGPEDKAVS